VYLTDQLIGLASPKDVILYVAGQLTPHVSLPAFSSFGGFRTPVAGVRGTVRERPASEDLHHP
jgi:hypothetical protein